MTHPSGFQAGTAWVQVLLSFDGVQKELASFFRGKAVSVQLDVDIDRGKLSKELDKAAEEASKGTVVTPTVHVDPKQARKDVDDATKNATVTPKVHVDPKQARKEFDDATKKLHVEPKVTIRQPTTPRAFAAPTQTTTQTVGLVAKADQVEAKIREIHARREVAVVDIEANAAKYVAQIKILEQAKLHKNIDVDANIAAYKAQIKTLTKEREQSTVEVDAETDKAQRALANLEKTFAYRITQAQKSIEKGLQSLRNLPKEAERAAEKGIPFDIEVRTDQIQKEIDYFRQRTISIPIEFEAKIEEARARVRELQDVKIRKTVEIDADIDVAKAKLRELEAVKPHINGDIDLEIDKARAELALLSARRETIDIKVNADVAKARAELATVDDQVRRLNGSRADIGIEAEDASNAIALMGRLIIAISAISYAAPAAAAAVALIPAAVLGLGVGAGAAAAGFNGISDAVKALQGVEDETATNSDANAQKRVAAANRIESAESSLARAKASAAHTAVQNDQSVRAASEAVADAQRSAAQRVEDAERSLSRAQDDAKYAQQALNDARKAAKERLEDLRLSLSGSKLDEEDAALGVERATERLKAAQTEFSKPGQTKVTGLDLRELALGVKQAKQNLLEVKERFGDVREAAAAANRAGVAGSTEVVTAQRAIEAANARVVDQERALRQAREDGARSVTKAQQGVVQAQQQAAYASQSAAASVADAQRNLEQASKASLDGSTAATDKLTEAMAKLTPEGRRFAHFLQDEMKPQLQGIGAAAAENMLPRVQNALGTMLKLGPLVTDTFAQTGTVLGTLAEQFANKITSPEWMADLDTIGQRSNQTLAAMGGVGLNLADMFRNLVVASGPFTEGLVRSISVGAENVSTWIAMKRESGELSAWFVKMGIRVRELWQDFKDIAGGVWDMIAAMAPLGHLIINFVGVVAQLIGTFADLNPTLFSMVIIAGLLFSGFVSLFRAVGGVKKAVGDSVGVFRSARDSLFGVRTATKDAATETAKLAEQSERTTTTFGRQGGVINATRDRFRGFRDSISDAYQVGANKAGAWAGATVSSTSAATRALGTFTPAVTQVQTQFVQLQGTAQSSLVNVSRAAGGTASALRRGVGGALSGLIGAMGGLAGLAITGVVVGLGLLAAKQADAASKAAEHEAQLQKLEDALVQTGGAIDDNVRKQIVDNLVKGSLIDNTERLGLSTEQLINDIAQGAGTTGDFAKSLDGVADHLSDTAGFADGWRKILKDLVHTMTESGGAAVDYERIIDDLGRQFQNSTGASDEATEAFRHQITQLLDLASGYHNVGGDFTSTAEKARLVGRAMEAAGLETGNAADATNELNEAIKPGPIDNLNLALADMGDESKTSTEKVDGLRTALEKLEDQTFGNEEAAQGINDGLRDLPALLIGAKGAAAKAGIDFIDASGAINTTTEEGSRLQDALRDLSESFRNEFTAAFEAATKAGKNNGEALAIAAQKTQVSRDRLVALAKQAELTAPEIQNLTNHYRLVPSILQTVITQPGMSRSIFDALGLGTSIRNVPNAWQTVLSSNAKPQITLLEDLGYTTKTLPNGDILVTVDSAEARAQLKNLTKTDYKTIAVDLRIRNPEMTPQQRSNALKNIRFASGGAVIPVTEKKEKPKPKQKSGGRQVLVGHRFGEVAEFWAAGGVRGMSARKADIVGSYRRTGVQRIIGDNPVADEAYIPLEKTARSIAILTEAAGRLGFAVTPLGAAGFAAGGVVGGAGSDTAFGGALDDLSTKSLPQLAATVDKSTVPTFQALEEHLGTTSVASVEKLTAAMTPLQTGLTTTGTVATAQWQRAQSSVTTSVTRQTAAMGALRTGMGSTRSAMSATASWAESQFGRMRNAAANPIRAMLAGPFNRGIIAAWNRLNKDFAFKKPVANIPIAFATGGRVPGVGRGDKVHTMLEPQEIVFDRQAISNLGGVERVERFRRMARAGIVGSNARLAGNGAERLRLMQDLPLDGLGFAFGGVVPHVARAGEEIMRKFGPLPGGIGGVGARGNVSDHPFGLALDFMTMQNTSLGNRIASYLMSNAQRLMLKYLIWQQRYNSGGGWDLMEDRGSVTANHLDHVHASFLALGQKGKAFTGGGLLDPASYFEKAFTMIANVDNAFPGNRAAEMSAAIARKAVDGVANFADTKVGMSQVAGSPQVIAAVRAVAKKFGWASGIEWNSLAKLISGESGFNPKAKNPTSSASGLFQKLTSMHGPIEPTVVGQTEWGLNYIKGAYGSPSNAYRQWLARSPHWYDDGGLLAPGYSTIYNGLRTPEKVLTDNQWSSLATLAGDTSGGGDFTGNLYLSSGEFMGVVRGEIDRANTTAGLTLARRIR